MVFLPLLLKVTHLDKEGNDSKSVRVGSSPSSPEKHSEERVCLPRAGFDGTCTGGHALGCLLNPTAEAYHGHGGRKRLELSQNGWLSTPS